MIAPFRGTPVSMSGSTCSPSTHASTSTGDLIVAAIHGFWATSLGAGVITAPAGWTLIGRADVPGGGANMGVVAHYVSTAGASGVAAHSFTFDAGFTGSFTSCAISTYAGALGVTGVHTDSRVAGAAISYTPPVPTPVVYARGVIGHVFFASSASPILGSFGWSTVQVYSGSSGQSGHLLDLPDQAPSMSSPVLSSASGSARCAVSYALVSDGLPALVHTGSLR